jgi:outer membrane receptor protein involved in Fe transport
MKKRQMSLSRAMQLALGGWVVVAAYTLPATAQDQDDPLSSNEVIELDRLVTGSRLISQVDIEGAAPVTVLDRGDIERVGLNDLAEIIRKLPSITGSPLSTRTNNGGNGASAVDIRGLGPGRTLVLINGRRDISNGDFSVIPVAAVERIDVLKEGASAIYGADAVAGVVNVITRRDFQGAEFSARYGRSLTLVNNPAAEELDDTGFSGSNGGAKRLSLVLGDTSEKSRFIIGLEYNEQEAVFQGNVDSPQFQQSLSLQDLDDYLAAGLGSVNRDIDGDGRPGLISTGSPTGLGGRFVTEDGVFTIDLDSREPREFNDCGDTESCGGDLYNFSPVNYLQTPFERVNLFVEGDYDLFDNVNAYVEARYSNRRSEQLLAPLPYTSLFDPAVSLGDDVFGVPASNVYNPFGEDVTEFNRRIVETGGRRSSNEINQVQLNAGLRGTLGDWAPTWDWDISWQWGRRSRIDTDRGQFVGERIVNAIGPSFFDDDDIARCGSEGNVIDGCVPLNLFGGAGTITPEQLAYVTADLNDRSTTKRQVLNASLNGDLLDLPAGSLGAAIGYEHRKESFNFIPDSGKATDAVTGNTSGSTSGQYDVNSVFAEVKIPLLSGVPGIELLELGGGFRYDNYSTIGSTGNFQGSLRWQPINSLLIRGSYSQVFREPNVSELFSALSDSFPTTQDVCSTGVVGNPAAPNLFSELTPEQQARCVSTGAPAEGFVQNSTQIRARVGGNPELRPETGDTYTVGFAWSPEFIPGFSLTADYWNVKLDDAITNIAAGNIIAQCVVEGNLDQCANINRRADGNLDSVLAVNTNIGAENASGVDVGINYSTNTHWGLFDSRLLLTYLNERESQVLNSADAAGRFESRNGLNEGVYPRWKGNLNVDWSYGNFGASVNVDYLGAVDEFNLNALNALEPGASEDTAFRQRIGAEWYVDLVGRYQFDWGTQLSAGLTNVFDNDPPFILGAQNANTDVDSYRLLGRSWFVQLKHSF